MISLRRIVKDICVGSGNILKENSYMKVERSNTGYSLM